MRFSKLIVSIRSRAGFCSLVVLAVVLCAPLAFGQSLAGQGQAAQGGAQATGTDAPRAERR